MNFKQEDLRAEITRLHPTAFFMLACTNMFCEINKIPLVITNVLTTPSNSTSITHRAGRAFDIRTSDLTIEQINLLMQYINGRFSMLCGAISYSDNQPRACIYHNIGYGFHLHVQCRDIKLDTTNFYPAIKVETTKETKMTELVDLNLSKEAKLELDFNGSDIVFKLGYAGKGGGASVAINVEVDYFIDLLKAKIPGQVDDAILEVVKTVLKMQYNKPA